MIICVFLSFARISGISRQNPQVFAHGFFWKVLYHIFPRMQRIIPSRALSAAKKRPQSLAQNRRKTAISPAECEGDPGRIQLPPPRYGGSNSAVFEIGCESERIWLSGKIQQQRFFSDYQMNPVIDHIGIRMAIRKMRHRPIRIAPHFRNCLLLI